MVYGVGIVKHKYPILENGRKTKEYDAWHSILRRCYSESYQQKCPTYRGCEVCNEWLLYDNFYEWITSQTNYKYWKKNMYWMIDKDIIYKGNKLYSPDRCCLVPQNINKLFIRSNATRGSSPIGVANCDNGFQVYCCNPFTNKQEYLGIYVSEIDAFNRYKNVKEKYIKDIAKIEYGKGTITCKCYEAMMNYKVEITD